MKRKLPKNVYAYLLNERASIKWSVVVVGFHQDQEEVLSYQDSVNIIIQPLHSLGLVWLDLIDGV